MGEGVFDGVGFGFGCIIIHGGEFETIYYELIKKIEKRNKLKKRRGGSGKKESKGVEEEERVGCCGRHNYFIIIYSVCK